MSDDCPELSREELQSNVTMQELKRLDHRLADCDAPVTTDSREAVAAI